MADDPMVADLLRRCTFPPPGTPLLCAVSGGPDSLALLVLAVAAGCAVTAVHVDHGLRDGSAAEADVVAEVAQRFGADFRSEAVTVLDGPNLEARARSARRQAIGPGAATGHTMDDQAETVLANLLRGAGVDGLSAMRRGTTHPILGLRRHETVSLCHHLGLKPIEDPSNRDTRFLRNRIRWELLPLGNELADRDIVPVLARQASLLADDADLLASVADDLDPTDAAQLASAPPAAARRALRVWLTDTNSYPPPSDAVERVLDVARGVRRAAEIPGGLRVARRAGRLRLEEVASRAPVQSRRG